MKAVSYLRVSTAAQGRSGLGLEAQRAAVEEFCRQRGVALLAELIEVESGAHADRPELAAAVITFLKNDTLRRATGEKGRLLIEQNRGALEKLLIIIREYLLFPID